MPQRIGPFRDSTARSLRTVVPCWIALSALAGVAPAQVGGLGPRDVELRLDPAPRVGVLRVEPSFDLDGVVPGELLAAGGARAIPAASWQPDLRAGAGFELDTHVVRSIPAVWSMRLPALDSLAELDVRCEIAGHDGQAGALTHPADSRSIIRVWVRSIAPQVVTGASGDVLVEGGVMLDMDLRDVRSAGPHTGTLTVTVEHF